MVKTDTGSLARMPKPSSASNLSLKTSSTQTTSSHVEGMKSHGMDVDDKNANEEDQEKMKKKKEKKEKKEMKEKKEGENSLVEKATRKEGNLIKEKNNEKSKSTNGESGKVDRDSEDKSDDSNDKIEESQEKQHKKKDKKKGKEKEKKMDVVDPQDASKSDSKQNDQQDSDSSRKKEKKKEKKEKKEKSVFDNASDRKVDSEHENATKISNEQKRSKDANAASLAASGCWFRKDFYTQHPAVRDLGLKVEQFREANAIHIQLGSSGTGKALSEADRLLLNPILNFAHAGFQQDLIAACAKFKEPTPIQSQCWPIALSGRDLIGIAKTGSGKTLAFALPSIVQMRDQKPLGKSNTDRGPVILVLCPTRELAMQTADVYSEVSKHAKKEPFRVSCIYGGVSKGAQRAELAAGVHVVVATPGRLRDFMNDGTISLSRVTCLILDEADRMLDLGFEADIRDIVGHITNHRQTLMFSATWPPEIEKIAREFLAPDTIRVSIGGVDLVANDAVHQIVEVIEPQQKDFRLLALLKQYHSSRSNKIIIFVLYKKEATRVQQSLKYKGYNVNSIHGDLSQEERSRALAAFRSGETPLLIATDVAARGLDIPNVEYVINYTFPLTIEDYVHRIGRTGRAGKKGISHTLFTALDKAHAGGLVNILRDANQDVPEDITKFGLHTKRKEHKLYGLHYRDDGLGEISEAKKVHITFED